VEGNHDQGLVDVMSHLVGVKAYQEYRWDFLGSRHMAIHGHQFDRFMARNFVISAVGSFLHLQLQKLDFKGKWLSRYVDRVHIRWLRLTQKVAAGAMAHARFHQADRIFCGHTHVPLRQERDGIEYYNSGCWTDSQPTYVTVGVEGVQIHEYRERTHDHHPSEERGEADSELADFADDAGLSPDAEYEGVGR
jgi:UDP-2,3-diacylglucosamine pyrophosphatase LpxH